MINETVEKSCGQPCGGCDDGTWDCGESETDPVCVSPIEGIEANVYEVGLQPGPLEGRQAFYPDDYEGDDVEKISQAISAAAAVEGAVVFNRIFDVDRNIGFADNVLYTGGGLRRACTPHSIVQRGVKAGDKCLSVDSVAGYKEGRGYKIIEHSEFDGVLTTFELEKSIPSELKLCARDAFSFDFGSEGKIISSFPMVSMRGGGYGEGVVIDSMLFDGNSECNGFLHDWRENATLYVSGKNIVKNSIFYDIPNENITSCGATIENNIGYNLGGSFIHKSCLAEKFAEETLENNYLDGSNVVGNEIMHHSEGLITFSANAGGITLKSNTFKNGKEGVFGYASAEDKDVYAAGDCYVNFPHLIRYSPEADESSFVFDATMIDVGPPIRSP